MAISPSISRSNTSAIAAGIDVSRILTPAATLRPGAAQTCQTKQDHGLESGLDLPELIGACASALPDDGAAPQPVYYETAVCNVRTNLPLTEATRAAFTRSLCALGPLISFDKYIERAAMKGRFGYPYVLT